MKLYSTLAATAVLLFGIAGASGAKATTINYVQDGDFSTPSVGGPFATYYSGSSMGSWKVESGSVDLIGSYWQAPDSLSGTGSVDMDGMSPGSISQTLSLNPGNYVLTFALSGNPDQNHDYDSNPLKTLRVLIGGVNTTFTFDTSVVGNSGGDMKYQLESISFSVAGSGPQSEVLSFMSGDSERSPFGAVIGKVSVTAVTPLPAALPMFLAALLGTAGFVFYRRRYI